MDASFTAAHTLARAVDRHPWLLTIALAVLGFLLVTDHSIMPSDFALFANSGTDLLHGRLSAVFSRPDVQAGPLALVLCAVLQRTSGWLGGGTAAMLQFVLGWINASCLVLAVRLGAGGRDLRTPAARRGAATLAAGIFAVAYGALSVTDAHPTHALIGLLWFLAARSARDGRATRAGVLLGLASALDTWGVLGAGVLLLLPSFRSGCRAALVWTLGIAACWLPFARTGSFHSFSMRWMPAPGSLPSMLFGDVPVPWTYRMLQGATAVATGTAIAWRLRPSVHAPWLIPAGVVAARLATDPINFLYYGVPLTIMLLTGLAALATDKSFSMAGLRAALQRPRSGAAHLAAQPLLWAALALLLPPVAGLPGGPLLEFAPSVGCLAVLVLLLSAGTRAPARATPAAHLSRRTGEIRPVL